MDSDIIARRAVTVADVARAAQVSKAAAARALGGYGSVSPVVRQRVLEAAHRLDYRPNELARTMATGRSGTIGVIIGDIQNPFFSLAVRGISDLAAESGFGVILSNSSEMLAAEQSATRVFLTKRVDGLIVAPATMHEGGHLEDALAQGCPLVLLDRDVPGLPVDVAFIDDRMAAREATDLLLALGHRRLAYITATSALDTRYNDPEQIALTTVQKRIAGFLEAGAAAESTESERQIRIGASSTARSQTILLALLRQPNRPTAILSCDSKIALEVFRAARALGLRVPQDLSLITFDDADWTSAVSPTVTVVSQPSYQLGNTAARMLIDRISGETVAPRRCVLETALIHRESVSVWPVSRVKDPT